MGRNEKKWILPLVLGATICFFIGASIAYFVIIPFILPVIIGEITIQVKVTDAFGISNASILIDNQMKFISSDPPYEWHWDEQGFGIHRLEIIAFDKNGNLAKKTIYMLKLL